MTDQPVRGENDPIGAILTAARTIAVVGMSDRPERDSHGVALYLQGHGYRIVPVNPMLDRVLGERCYPSLGDIPHDVQIDIVDIFRRPDAVPAVVEAAIARAVPVVWMQLGAANAAAAERARAAGITVVADRCIKVEHMLRSRPTASP